MDVPLEDMHIHSTYSDGTGSLEENLRAAHHRSLEVIGCTDHVRRESAWLEKFTSHIHALRRTTHIRIEACIETKMLDTHGTLDMPACLDGIDRILFADHQLPLEGALIGVREANRRILDGELHPSHAVESLVLSVVNAFRHRNGLLWAHPMSFLPKIGISLDEISRDQWDRIAKAARITNGAIEVSERWRCPNSLAIQIFHEHRVPIRISTDSHRPDTIGVFEFVPNVLAASRI